jgi:hypothetical protein
MERKNMGKRHSILTLAFAGLLLASGLPLSNLAAANQNPMPPPSNSSQLADEQATLQAFEQAAAQADAAMRKARAVGGEWPDTGQTLQQALAAAEVADYGTAIRLFETIETESEKSYQQVLAQREAAKKEAAAKAAAEKAALQKPATPAAK